MEPTQKDVILKSVLESVQSLYQDIDRHRSVITSLLEGQSCSGNGVCSRELRLKRAIRDAIEVLEESRKAFKSKQLEILRRQLTQVLAEAG